MHKRENSSVETVPTEAQIVVSRTVVPNLPNCDPLNSSLCYSDLPTIKLFPLLLPNCNFAAVVMNYNVFLIWETLPWGPPSMWVWLVPVCPHTDSPPSPHCLLGGLGLGLLSTMVVLPEPSSLICWMFPKWMSLKKMRLGVPGEVPAR